MVEKERDTYSPVLCFVYCFNLIVGVGALSMPHGFQLAGLFLSTILLVFIAFCAYLSVTFVIETMAAANAMVELCGDEDDESYLISQSSYDDSDEDVGGGSIQKFSVKGNKKETKSVYEITRRFEMGTMAKMFCGKNWETVFYCILFVFLYGDLAIYAVSVPASIQAMTEQYIVGDVDSTGENNSWTDNLYYLYLIVYSVCILPFCFLNFQKTKYLQYATVTMRNLTMLTIMVLSIYRLANGRGAKWDHIRKFEFKELPSLFGTIVYAFMCHHSLPSIVTPVNDKKHIFLVLALTYFSICCVYTLINFLTIFAYGDPCETCFNDQPCVIEDLITETFAEFTITTISVFLTLYPVFTLSTNYPLISITCRNNLMNCITYGSDGPYAHWRPYIFSVIAAVPPLLIAFCTQNVYRLVDITGAYGGVGIQWFIPVILVYHARKRMEEIAPGFTNPYASPFQHKAWLIGLLVLTALAIIISTFNLVYDAIVDIPPFNCTTVTLEASSPGWEL